MQDNLMKHDQPWNKLRSFNLKKQQSQSRKPLHKSIMGSFSFRSIDPHKNKSKNKQKGKEERVSTHQISMGRSGTKELRKCELSNSQRRKQEKAGQKKGQRSIPRDRRLNYSCPYLALTRTQHRNSGQRPILSIKKEQKCQKSRSNKQEERSISYDSVKFKERLQKEKAEGNKIGELSMKEQVRFSFRTRKGLLASNPNKTNQDRILVDILPIGEKEAKSWGKKNLFVVADGHGMHGHHVSELLVEKYTKIALELVSQGLSIEETFQRSYDQLQRILAEGKTVDASCSGSTLVSVFLGDSSITCANVGDSRAILARQCSKKSWEIMHLSEDQKPCVASEKRRILQSGGRVHRVIDCYGESVGPERAWLPHKSKAVWIVDKQGLAMSRSMGDNISKPIGVIHDPQIVKVPTDDRDRFIVIASDGVWQFLSNEEVLKLIVPYYRDGRLEAACEALLKLAYGKWTVEDCSVVDDITFIIIFMCLLVQFSNHCFPIPNNRQSRGKIGMTDTYQLLHLLNLCISMLYLQANFAKILSVFMA